MKPVRRPKELDEFEVKDEQSSFEMRSSGGARRARQGPQSPTEAGASALARGWRWCICMDSQYQATVGAVLPTQGAREGVQY